MTTQPLNLGNSLLVTLIGMIIVFFGLTILIFLIKALVRLTENLGRKKTPVRTVTPPPAPAPAPVAVEEPEENEDELIAVITAAIIIPSHLFIHFISSFPPVSIPSVQIILPH